MANSAYNSIQLIFFFCYELVLTGYGVCLAVARSFLQVAATEEVASPLRVVQIEGLVISLSLVLDFYINGKPENPRNIKFLA